jgi:hypothetical protein
VKHIQRNYRASFVAAQLISGSFDAGRGGNSSARPIAPFLYAKSGLAIAGNLWAVNYTQLDPSSTV